MSEIILNDFEDYVKISNVRVYDLEESIQASKFPKSVDISQCNTEITERQISLGNCITGTGHDCYLKGIICNFNLTCSNKMWVEFQRYHFADIVSSQSTMHKITQMDLKNNCIEYVTDNTINEVNRLIDIYNKDKTEDAYLSVLYNVPSGLQLTARITTSYLQFKTMLKQREFHKLPEWRGFCRWLKTLPYSDLFISKR